MLDRLEIIDYLLAANNGLMFVKYLISIGHLKVNICNTLLQKANALYKLRLFLKEVLGKTKLLEKLLELGLAFLVDFLMEIENSRLLFISQRDFRWVYEITDGKQFV